MIYYPTTSATIRHVVDYHYSTAYAPDDVVVSLENLFAPIADIRLQYPNSKIIAYQTAQLQYTNPSAIKKNIESIAVADEVWCSDMDIVSLLKLYGVVAKFAPLLYTPRLQRIATADIQDIDVFYYGEVTQRVSDIARVLFANNIVIRLITDTVHVHLDQLISRSKIILEINTSPHLFQNQEKLHYLLVNNKCIVTEKSHVNYYGTDVIESDYRDIASTIMTLLQSDTWKNHINSKAIFPLMTARNFKTTHYIEQTKKYGILYSLDSPWRTNEFIARWIVEKLNPSTIIDYNINTGYSTFAFAIPKIGRVYGVDNFDNSATQLDDLRSTLNEFKLHNVEFINSSLENFLSTTTHEFDLVHLNVDDTITEFIIDACLARITNTGALMVFDPSTGIQEYINSLNLSTYHFKNSRGTYIISKNINLITEIADTFPY